MKTMKKIVSLAICFMLALSLTTVSFADSIDATYNASTREITVTGEFTEQPGNITVFASSSDAFSDINASTIKEAVIGAASWDGTGSLVIKVKSGTAEGYYNVFAGAKGFGEILEDRFYLSTQQQYLDATAAFTGATSATISDIIDTWCVNSPIVMLPLDNAVYTANTVAVQKVFASCLADTSEEKELEEGESLESSDISACFNEALAVVELNLATDKYSILSAKQSVLGIPVTEDSTKYMKDAASLMMKQTEAKDGLFNSQDDVASAFNKAVAVLAVNGGTRETVRGLLKQYEDILKIDVDGGYESANESNLNIAMAFGSYETPEEVAAAFNEAVLENKGSSGDEGSSSGSSSSGRPSKGGNYSSVTVGGSYIENPVIPKAPFTDLEEHLWAYEAIDFLKSKNVVSGVRDDIFEPARNVLREEFAKMIVNAFSINSAFFEKKLADVPGDAWYHDAVLSAYNQGIINGIDSQHFGTGMDITREDAVVILYRYLVNSGYSFGGEIKESFDDMSNASSYAIEAINTMKAEGIISGKTATTFAPKDKLSRAEAATLIYKVMKEKGLTQ